EMRKAAAWLIKIQNPDGGWGESLWSYHDPNTRGVGESTYSQTAWATMALMAAGDTRSDCLHRGIEYLLANQRENGSWWEKSFTGTGFPKVFYLKYHAYAEYFPVLALATYRKHMSEEKEVVS
ncbi:MAG TPA: prenyltransferase/squalene oxidase repeat-containing protein, partial [Terriglobales bacterium]|nr:prenyltransferase/squalene oxidase repeat-containing protein [Terriglobales bacterium]